MKAKLAEMRRNADNEFDILYAEATELAKQFGVNAEMPRRVGTQKYRSNILTSDVKLYYRATLFIPYIEEVICNLDSRFSGNENVVKGLSNIVPTRVVSYTTKDFEDVVTFYEKDLTGTPRAVLKEINLWAMYWKEKKDRPSNPLDAILNCNEQLFPNIFILMQILVTIPVTTATAERSFSTLKRVKTYLRNKMETGRTSSLALMSTYKNDVDIDEILKLFFQRKRRSNF